VVVLDAAGRAERDGARLEALFTAARQEELTEFLADCGKFDAEIDKEVRNAKFTMAELEEEEHSLERLRRWYRELKTRDAWRTLRRRGRAAPQALHRAPGRLHRAGFPVPAPNVTPDRRPPIQQQPRTDREL
jgi:hypothetical protein